MNVKAKEEIGTTLVQIMQKEGLAKNFLADLVMMEIDRIGTSILNIKNLLRVLSRYFFLFAVSFKLFTFYTFYLTLLLFIQQVRPSLLIALSSYTTQ